jgi:putative transcriptional regulator
MNETIHNRIAMLRAERKISRRQLADALGVHYQTVGYLERGEFSPSLFLALRIAEFFEVAVSPPRQPIDLIRPHTCSWRQRALTKRRPPFWNDSART